MSQITTMALAPSTEDQRPTAAPVPTPAELVSTPLPQLLAEHHVIVADPGIADPTFFGVVVVRADGRIVLALPPGRSEFERDTIARYLLGRALGVPVAPLREPFTVTDTTAAANALLGGAR